MLTTWVILGWSRTTETLRCRAADSAEPRGKQFHQRYGRGVITFQKSPALGSDPGRKFSPLITGVSTGNRTPELDDRDIITTAVVKISKDADPTT
jgi:hypothetical protein